jgi:hypothetical protein
MSEGQACAGGGTPSADDGRGTILVIVPAFNEEEALAGCVCRLRQTCPQVDVLIVNDGSTDGTENVAAELAAAHPRVRYVSLPFNCGIGATVQTGLVFARRNGYDWAVQYDGDGQHDPNYLLPMVDQARTQGLDLCVGSRFLNLDAESFKSTWLRRVGIIFFARLIGLLTQVRVTDPTSGFRVYGRCAIGMFAEYYPEDYPEPEALFRCARNRLRVGEYPVAMNERQGGQSSIRHLRTAYYMLKVTLAILVDRIRSKDRIAQHDS